jgi:hypothetical protein
VPFGIWGWRLLIAVIPGRMKAAKPLKGEPGIPECSAQNMSGFRVRLREGAQPPRNDSLKRQDST